MYTIKITNIPGGAVTNYYKGMWKQSDRCALPVALEVPREDTLLSHLPPWGSQHHHSSLCLHLRGAFFSMSVFSSHHHGR